LLPLFEGRRRTAYLRPRTKMFLSMAQKINDKVEIHKDNAYVVKRVNFLKE